MSQYEVFKITNDFKDFRRWDTVFVILHGPFTQIFKVKQMRLNICGFCFFTKPFLEVIKFSAVLQQLVLV